MFKRMPPKFSFFYNEYKDKNFRLLDVGCGNNSPSRTKKFFKNCKYFGLDRENYNNSVGDLELMEKFYDVDLECDPLDIIPNEFFDVIILAHVIEHISNGVSVVERLSQKLKIGGIIYIEYPSVRSLNFPSLRGTLHFCDDPTHIKLYDLKEVCNALLSRGFKIRKAGVLRDAFKMVFFPFLLFFHLIRGTVSAGLFWYVLGFSEFVYAVKVR